MPLPCQCAGKMANLLEKLTRGSEDLVVHEELKKVRVANLPALRRAPASSVARRASGTSESFDSRQNIMLMK